MLLVAMVTACDPTSSSTGEMDEGITAEQLKTRVQLKQNSEGENNFTFTTSPTIPIQICNANGDILAYGVSGSLQTLPGDANPKFIIRAINADGSVVSYEQSFTVNKYVDVPEIYANIFGADYGTTTWTWDDTANGVWGNGSWGSDTAPAWWVVSINDIDEQAKGKNLPNDGKDGWMKFTCNGMKIETSRGESGTMSINTTPSKEGWDVATVTFSGTIPLMGVLPNNGNARCYTYSIVKADGEHLVLAAEESSSVGWFLCFKKVANK